MRHVLMFSGGVGSWAAAKRVVEKYGADKVTLLFADTKMEDADLYRFITEAAKNVGAPLTTICDGRTPWEVFHDERFLGNSRIDPCSKHLKRIPSARWLRDNCNPAETVVYVGIDWTESHRYDDGKGGGIRPRQEQAGWIYKAPMCDPPYMSKRDMIMWMKSEGIEPPRLYKQGFAHNNCGGFCCKAGQGHFANLLRVNPILYQYHEQKEIEIREYLDADVSMMVDTSHGVKRPLTMKMVRDRIEAGGNVDLFSIGGCGCFIDAEGE